MMNYFDIIYIIKHTHTHIDQKYSILFRIFDRFRLDAHMPPVLHNAAHDALIRRETHQQNDISTEFCTIIHVRARVFAAAALSRDLHD